MLFPDRYLTEEDKSSYNIVLKDEDNNRIFSSIKISSNMDENSLKYEDTDTLPELSKCDLKILFTELSNHFNNFNSSTPVANHLSLKSFLTIQDKELQKMQCTAENSDILSEISNNKFPSLTECLNTQNFVFKTNSQISHLLKKEIVNTSFNDAERFSAIPRLSQILERDSTDDDFDDVMEFATEFRKARLELGMTQTEVSISMENDMDVYFNQTTICRFENKAIPLTNLKTLMPAFMKWLRMVNTLGRDKVWANVIQYRKEKKKQDPRRHKLPPMVTSDLEILFQKMGHTMITTGIYQKFARRHNVTKRQIQLWMALRRKRDRFENRKY